MEKLISELNSTDLQTSGVFNRIIRRFTQYLTTVLERAIEKDLRKKSSKNNNEEKEEISQISIASNKDEESVKVYIIHILNLFEPLAVRGILTLYSMTLMENYKCVNILLI